MHSQAYSVLFLAKENDDHVQRALKFLEQNFTDVTVHFGKWGDALPAELDDWEGDYIISYLSRWVIPDWLLSRARHAAINFHPASPDYPGIGCNNFALYDNAKEYGVTCHHMAKKVDTGRIIAVKRFPVYPSDDVASLLARSYDFQLVLFYEVMSHIIEGNPLPVSDERWTRAPISRKEFNKLGRITPDMTPDEICRRIRAISFGDWKPTIEVQGFVFELKAEPAAEPVAVKAK